MSEPGSNIETFDRCVNRSYRLKGIANGEVVCPQYPEGGVWFDQTSVIREAKPSEREYLAQRLGCAACPYPDAVLSKVVIERFDDNGRRVHETRFEPVVNQPTETLTQKT